MVVIGMVGENRRKTISRLRLCDTGSPFDVVGRAGLPDGWIQERIEVLEEPVRMETANGEILADRTIGLEFEAIGEQEIRPFVLENAPDLISIGRRCLEMGYSFHWPSGSKSPFFVLPESNQRVHLQVVDYLPYLVDEHNTEGLTAGTPTSALPVRESTPASSSSTAPGADPSTGSGPPAVEVTTAAGNGGEGEDEQEPEMTKSVKEQLQAQAKSLGHLMSHQPFNPFCRACVEGRTRKKPRRKGGLTAAGEAESGTFGDLITGDHLIARKGPTGDQFADAADKFGQDHLDAKVAVVVRSWHRMGPVLPEKDPRRKRIPSMR